MRGKNRTTTSARRVLLVSFEPVPQPDTVHASHIMYKSSWTNLAVVSLSFIYFWVAILTTNTHQSTAKTLRHPNVEAYSSRSILHDKRTPVIHRI